MATSSAPTDSHTRCEVICLSDGIWTSGSYGSDERVCGVGVVVSPYQSWCLPLPYTNKFPILAATRIMVHTLDSTSSLPPQPEHRGALGTILPTYTRNMISYGLLYIPPMEKSG